MGWPGVAGVAVPAGSAYRWVMDPRTPRSWRDVRTGALILLGLVPVTAGVFFLDALRRAFVEGPTLVVVAEEIRGLAPGAAVWVAGKPVGRVTDVSFIGPRADRAGSIALRVVLLRDAGPALRRDARAQIGRSALLSPPIVKLDPGSPELPPFDFADTLVAAPGPNVDDFRALADTGRQAVGELADDLGRLARELDTGRGTLQRLRRDPALAGTLARQGERAAALRAAWGDAGPGALLADTAVRRSVARIGDDLEALRALAADTAPAVRARRELTATLSSVRGRLGRLDARLDLAEGTLGRMATDDELRTQTARARAALDSLRMDAAADPLRFLRFRLF